MLISYEILFEVIGTHAAEKALHFELTMCLISPYIIFHLYFLKTLFTEEGKSYFYLQCLIYGIQKISRLINFKQWDLQVEISER